MAYDPVDWSSAQLDTLELLLSGRRIPHEWGRDHVVVPAARADEVDDLLDGLGPEPSHAAPVQDDPSAEDAADSAREWSTSSPAPAAAYSGLSWAEPCGPVVSKGLSYTGPFVGMRPSPTM